MAETPLPSWSESDVQDFIASDPVHGPVLKTAREAVNYGIVGSAVGAVTTAGVCWKYSKSPHGAEMDDAQLMKGDKLVLRGLKFHGFHGVKPEEKKLGQKFVVDVDAWMDLHKAGISDCLSDTISYSEIYRIVKEVVEGKSRDLLESVAQQIATITFSKFPQISAVRVEVKKPHVAVQGQIDYFGIEIFRSRPAGTK